MRTVTALFSQPVPSHSKKEERVAPDFSIGKIRLRRFCGLALRCRPAKGATFAGLCRSALQARARRTGQFESANE
jgi:hypothetical protein